MACVADALLCDCASTLRFLSDSGCVITAKITWNIAWRLAIKIKKKFSCCWQAAMKARARAKARKCMRQTKLEGGARPRAKAETEADHQGGMLHEAFDAHLTIIFDLLRIVLQCRKCIVHMCPCIHAFKIVLLQVLFVRNDIVSSNIASVTR